MLVRFLHDIYDNHHNERLNDFFIFFKYNKHKLLFDNSADIEAYESSSWFEQLDSKQKLVIKKHILISSRKVKNIKTVCISNNSLDVNFTPEEGFHFLDQQLTILIENSEYDAPFVDAIIKNFDYSGELKYAQDCQWCQYEMGGGSSIDSVIRSKLEHNFNNPIFIKSKEKYLRLFVITDSDKKFPDMDIAEHKYRLFVEKNIPYHILYKREKENYIPDSVYRKLSENNRKYIAYSNVYLNLNNPQKDFLDIEKGFSSKKDEKGNSTKSRNELTEQEQKLFNKLTQEEYEILDKGFNQFINVKKDFSAKFKELSREEMLSRVNHQSLYTCQIDNKSRNEFEHIVNEIKKIL